MQTSFKVKLTSFVIILAFTPLYGCDLSFNNSNNSPVVTSSNSPSQQTQKTDPPKETAMETAKPTEPTKAQESNIAIDQGKIYKGTYINEALGITVLVPEGWKLYRSDNSSGASEQKTFSLFTAYEDPDDEGGANYALTVEKRGESDKARFPTADDYISSMRSDLNLSGDFDNVQLKTDMSEIQHVDINGKDFVTMNFTVSVSTTEPVSHDVFIYMDENYMYMCMSRYKTEKEREIINDSIYTLQIGGTL